MVRNRFADEDDRGLRSKLFEVLAKSKTSAQEDLAALSQCTAYIRDRMLIEEIASECGLKHSKCKTNDALELYYDLKQGRNEVGYISKGWDDPGFRIGDVIRISKARLEAVKVHTHTLLQFCATRGVVLAIEPQDDSIEYQMTVVIYSDGFNKEVFVQALRSLVECVDKAEELLSQ